MSKINKPNVLQWIACRLKEVSARSVKRERGDLLTMWRFAFKEGFHLENPDVQGIPVIRCPKRSPTAWHLDQLQSWIEAAGRLSGSMRGSNISCADWWTAFILFLYSTASRPSAALSVRPGDIDLDRGFVILRAITQKTGHDDICRLNEQAITAVRKIYCPRARYVFHWPYHADVIWRQFKQISKQAGLPTDRYHSLGCMRRTTASLVAANGSVELAQQLLGHSSPDITRRYYLDPKIACSHSAIDVLPKLRIC